MCQDQGHMVFIFFPIIFYSLPSTLGHTQTAYVVLAYTMDNTRMTYPLSWGKAKDLRHSPKTHKVKFCSHIFLTSPDTAPCHLSA